VAGYQTVPQRNLTCAARIRERRRELGLTQADVVRRVGADGSRLSNQALSAIENGRRLAVGRLPDLAAALECTVTFLVGLTADPRRWEPDEAAPEAAPAPAAPEAAPAPAAREAAPVPAVPEAAREAAPAPAADRVTPPHGSWILGPDVPDIRGEAAPYSWRSV
jgi:transcriptional regulator with XRE-family HTH domain